MQKIEIDSGFPGGNGVVDRIDGDRVFLHQELRDTEGFWFYWHFRVRGAAGRTLTFTFTEGAPVGVRGAAVSRDDGGTWTWESGQVFTQDSFTHTFAPGEHTLRFSFGMPYTAAHWDRFLARLGARPGVRPGILCTSRKGRPVEVLRLEPPSSEPRFLAVVTCRHHCCEMMANDVLEGLIEAFLADDACGRRLRRTLSLLVVPFVDKDGVEDGDQGKNRVPRDHGRDYDDKPIYPETKTVRDLIAQERGGRELIGIDLHCPWIRGEWNELIYQVGCSGAAAWEAQQRFGVALEKARTGPLPYTAASNLPFGAAWNTDSNYNQGRGFSKWVSGLPRVALATSFEIPYANAGGVEVNAASARAFGCDLARALDHFLGATQ